MMAVSGEQAADNDDNSSTGPIGIVATANDAAPQAIAAMEPEPSRQLCTTGSTHTQATHPQTCEQVFARRLITRGALSYSKQQSKQQGDEVTTIKDAVLAFNSALYNRTMSPSSTDFDGNIDVELLNAEIFRVGDVWASRNLLCNALNCRASCEGFTVKVEKNWVGCNRVGKPTSSRGYAGGELKANCTLCITIQALAKERYERPRKNANDRVKFEYRALWDMPIKLVDNESSKIRFNTRHGGECRPSCQNRIATQQRSGNYLKKIPDPTMFSLLHMFEQNGGCISSSTIKNTIAPVWPKQKAMTKHDVFKIKVKLVKLLPIFKQTNGDFQKFQEQATSNELLSGIDDAPCLNDDEAYDMAASSWFEIRNSFGGKRVDAVFQFVDYLKLIQARAKGFAFKLAEDTSGKKKKLLGVLWMTATMRRNFELYGDYISLDMMKRGLNTLLWPYIGVAMYDNMKKLCIACEGILCGEQVG